MMILPFSKGDIQITSKHGYRTIFGGTSFHPGLDIVGKDTDEVVSVSNGRVLWSQWADKPPTSEWGNYVAVTGDDGCTIYYCHLKERRVKAGERVKAGDVIGIMGSTGKSTGPHLHFEVRPNNASASNAAIYLNLPNAICEISEKHYYSDEVCKACGFTDGTRAYINAYNWAGDLWRKLAVAMRLKEGKTDRAGIIKRCGFLPHTVKFLDEYKFASDLWRKLGDKM
ncbi:MAG: M23 family metallopeptidase [Clostridia bacterium]|nr:M23 family metallopeptidase [Clostridia bacterium]